MAQHRIVEALMSLKCANTACEQHFHIKTGRLFYLRIPRGKAAHHIRHFWLCQTCSTIYTVELDGNHPKIRQKGVEGRKAAATSVRFAPTLPLAKETTSGG
jgi:hypothetical protein